MWTCSKCGEESPDHFDSCWKCQTARPGIAEPPLLGAAAKAKKLRVAYRYFRSTFSSWEELFGQAAEFATKIGPERLIGISHSEDNNNGVVTVWFWAEDGGSGEE